ncbi:MAG: hypothetical protein J5631_03645 [Spirochaetaceae bacterium]|nr:hypothetical protein [Spirochaetaceae bacterium]
MEKALLILFSLCLLSSCYASRKSGEPSAFSSEERTMKKKILKCKDVVEVVIKTRQDVSDCRAKIYIKLTNDRYLEFNHVKYSSKSKMDNFNLEIIQIGNIIPICISYKMMHHGSKDNPDYHYDVLDCNNVYLSDISNFCPEIQTLEDVVNNYEMICEFIQKLSNFPEEFQPKSYKLYEKGFDLQDWKSYKTDYSYYNEFDKSYRKIFKFYVSDYNDWCSQKNPNFTKQQNYFNSIYK